MLGFGKKTVFALKAPLSGTPVLIEKVPDKAFSAKMLGDGAAIEPTSDTLLAPCDASVEVLFPTGHAIALKADNGLEILLHVGIDTVELKGMGFEKLVSRGDRVKTGQPLLRFDAEKIKEAGKNIVTPVLITNMDLVKSLNVSTSEQKAGETNLMEITLA